MSIQAGYNRQFEDKLLAGIDWPQDGYRLFEIGTPDESSLDGWFFPTQESNALFMKREVWMEHGGADERFDAPGGGLLNLDLFRRAMQLPGARLVRLLGEATFHQFHGGTATNAAPPELHQHLLRWSEQYTQIRGGPYMLPMPRDAPTLIGIPPRAALVHFLRAAIDPVWSHVWGGSNMEPPLGRHFYRELWSCASVERPTNPKFAAILDLAHAEFRARRYDSVASLARLIFSRDPNEPEARRLLALTGGWLLEGDKGLPRSLEYHRAQSTAYKILGELKLAAVHSRRVPAAIIKARLRPVALGILDLVSSTRHPFDQIANERAFGCSAIWHSRSAVSGARHKRLGRSSMWRLLSAIRSAPAA
jgi:hypothetical protein